jgi:hypothetical protein
MSTYKNISDDWYITVNGGAGTVYVDGSLDVSGNITYVSDIAVNDAFIIVAANNQGTVQSMGLIATGNALSNTYAGLRYNSVANAWQVSSSVQANGAPVVAYANIVTGGSALVAGANTELQFNNSGAFGANANLTYDYANSVLTVNGVGVYGNIGTTPAYTGNGIAVYNNVIGQGGTGLYVKNSDVNDELVSRSRAIAFSLIF